MEGKGTSPMQERKAPPDGRYSEQASEAWKHIPWRKLERYCFRIQKRIFRASQHGNQRAVHKLQKLLMKSKAARTLAVRRVTQDNQGKKTAGIDGKTALLAHQRLTLVQEIHPNQWPKNVNPNIILAKIQQLSWWTRSHKALAYQDNCCESHQFNPGIYIQRGEQPKQR
jgi:RNA-directed DNA polymerase